jgi:hypothetical protein
MSSLYEDDGVSFDYEKGAFTRIEGSWNDSSRTLNLTANSKGRLPKEKAFTVEVAGSSQSKRLVMSGAHASIVL